MNALWNFVASYLPPVHISNDNYPSGDDQSDDGLGQHHDRPLSHGIDTHRATESNGEEHKTLKSFLTKTDDFSGQQIIQAVHDLNTEILQLAAAVSDEFPLSRCASGSWKESHCELVRDAIGDGMLALLRDGDHENDPTVVQLAIQAWEVWCCQQVLDAFCAGVSPEVDRFLNDIFREMQLSGKHLSAYRT